MLALPYGTDCSLRLELEGDALAAVCDGPRGKPVEDVAQAVQRALAAPLDFPPLAQAAVPGDKVVLALDDGVPRAATLLRETIEILLECGLSAADITLLHSQAEADRGSDPLAELPPSVSASIARRVHDPQDRRSLSYLAAAADARPIYVNRAIHDADLVIPIGIMRLADSLGYYGVNSALFPAFSNSESLRRFRSPQATARGRRDRLRQQADEVGWLLGVRFTIQVVPGAASEVLHVLAGDVDAVFREGSRLCDVAWSHKVPGRADLVVATIEGDARQQTWHNVGRALEAAALTLEEDGAVVICSELAEPFGPALQRLVGADDLDSALDEIARGRYGDALAATQLVHALRRGKVYLVSRLEDESVEELGVLPIDGSEVSRLARRYRSCIVLAGAQYAQARPGSKESFSAPNRSRS